MFMALYGMTGWVKPANIDNPETVPAKGVGFALNPASPIFGPSPYILDCSAFFNGGIGAYVDGNVHAVGNKSMLFYGYTNINDEGIGFWSDNGGVIESVSNFTYYAAYGYLATRGGYLRGLNGSNSWGTWALFSKGFLPAETPITGELRGTMIEYSNLISAFQAGETLIGATSGAEALILNVQAGSNSLFIERTTMETFIDNEDITTASGSAKVLGSEFGQKGALLVLTNLTAIPAVRQGVSITGDALSYVVASVSGTYVDTTSTIVITLANNKPESSAAGTAVALRQRYSQIRVTGHDFLNVGSGGVASITANGGTLLNPGTPPVPGQQVGEFDTGRVFSVSTDQDGNFRVGKYFAIDQGTGRATLDASAFDLSGLTSLRLGSIGAQLGEAINEFSSDPLLTQNSNEKVSTQFAVKTYVDNKFVNNAVFGNDVTVTNDLLVSNDVTVTNDVTITGNLLLDGEEVVNKFVFTGLLDANDWIDGPPSSALTVTNSGSTAYVIDAENNPTITVVKGETYTFTINADGFPFQIQTVSGAYSASDVYDTGITNLGEDDGTITWVVDSETPSELYYVCEFFSAMTGTIIVLDYLPPDDGSFVQTISMVGIKDDDAPFIDLDLANVDFEDVEDVSKAFINVFRVLARTDDLTFYAKELPEDDIPVKVRR
jgi:hypothetical protein